MVKKPSYEELKKRVQELEEKLAGQKMSEEALDVHNILNAIEEGYYEVDLAGNFTYFNQATYRNLGYSRDELMHMNNRDYMAPEAAKRIFIIFNEVYRTGKTIQSLDFEVIRKDGSKRIHEMSVSLLRDKKGDPVGFRGISRDRTDLIQMERALREREESYRQVLELAPDAILIMKVKDHRYLEVNDAFCQMTGYSREEAIGRTALDLNLYPDPDERQRLVEAFRTRGGLTGFEIQIRAKNGTIMEHLISGRPIRFQGENAALIMARDITSLKKVQKELRKSEDKYRLVVENVQEGILITQDGLIRFANPKIKELLGYQTDELIDLPMTRIIHPDYQDLVLNYHYQRLAGEPAPEVYEFKMAARDGSAPWVETRSVRIDWEGFPATLSLHADITERKKIEEALREREESYRRVLELAPDIITISRIKDGRYKQVNQTFCRLSGYSMEEIIGRTPFELGIYMDPSDRERMITVLNRQGRLEDFEILLSDRWKNKNHTLLSAVPMLFEGEDCMLTIARNVNKIKATEQALRESEETSRRILDLAPDVIMITRLSDGKYLQNNEAFYQLSGYKPEETLGKTVFDINFYADPTHRARLLKALRDHGRVEAMEIPFQAKDGSILNCLISARPLQFKGESCILSVVTDVSFLKETQEALRESEERYRNILENIEEGYWEIDLKGRFTFYNDAFWRLCGSPPREFLTGLSAQDYATPEEAKRLLGIFAKVYQSGNTTEVLDFEATRYDGALITIEMSVSLLKDAMGNPIGFHGISRDRTEQRKAEKALRESEEKYRNILENMEEGYWEIDLNGNFIFFNDAVPRIWGYTKEELKGLNNQDYMTPETARKVYGIYNTVYQTGVPIRLADYEIIRKDGTVITIESSASLRRDDSGRPIGFCGVSRDISDRIKAEKALAESEEKYRLLVENADEGICIIQDGVIKFPNPKTEILSGYSAEELTRIPFGELIHPEDQETILGLSGGKTGETPLAGSYSFRLVNKGNEILWIGFSSVNITWEGRPATLNFLRDITPEKKMEAQFIQAQRMEATGTLAGGIAHNFNNLLMGIQGNASLVLMDMDRGHPDHEKLVNIEQLVKEGAALTKELLGLAKGGKYEVRSTDLNDLMTKSSDLFGRTKKEIRIHKKFQEQLWPVEVDRSQIEQVLLNLFVNAWQAMPAGGDLYLETGNVILEDYYVKPYGLKPGRFARMSVTDTGMGMSDATLKRIFDPFFTTKEVGRGTGLGLASAYGIIKNHGGLITVYSEKGQGSTFNLYLPASDKPIDKEAEPIHKVIYGSETILFVDDEEGITLVGRRILERLGYRVIVAGSGPEAVEIYRRDGHQIDLIILDMIMPGLSGGDTFDCLKEIDPSIKVLLSSGYSLNGQAKTILERGCKGFLQKPFSVADLSKKIRQVLDG